MLQRNHRGGINICQDVCLKILPEDLLKIFRYFDHRINKILSCKLGNCKIDLNWENAVLQ